VGVGAAEAVNLIDTDTKAAITNVADSDTAVPLLYAATDALVRTNNKPVISGTSNMASQALQVDIDTDRDGVTDSSYAVTTAADGSWSLDLATDTNTNDELYAGLVDGQQATVSVSSEGHALTSTAQLIYSTTDRVEVLENNTADAGLLAGISNLADATVAVDVNVDRVVGTEVTYAPITEANGNGHLALQTATPSTGEIKNL